MSASPPPRTDLSALAAGYALCAAAEGKSPATIRAVVDSVRYLWQFLASEELSTDALQIGPPHIRMFMLYLRQKRCLSGHPYSGPQERGLSSCTINGYLRSIRAFWSWLLSEGIVPESPFWRVRVPPAGHKVIPTFSGPQLKALFGAIDASTAEGFRDYAMLATLLDTGLRLSELLGLTLDNARLQEGELKVLGKGNRERMVPIGREARRLMWRYIQLHRPREAGRARGIVFLTFDGRPVTKNRLQSRMARYGRRAGIAGVRCSPHTLRHTAAVSFLRNGGNAFSLQRLLGHSSLEMTRRYCQLADVDVKRAHQTASPLDNLGLRL